MILLMHPKYRSLIEEQRDAKTFGDAVPSGTPVFFDPYLPETDDEGNPILAFKVDENVVWAWKGEPIYKHPAPLAIDSVVELLKK